MARRLSPSESGLKRVTKVESSTDMVDRVTNADGTTPVAVRVGLKQKITRSRHNVVNSPRLLREVY